MLRIQHVILDRPKGDIKIKYHTLLANAKGYAITTLSEKKQAK